MSATGCKLNRMQLANDAEQPARPEQACSNHQLGALLPTPLVRYVTYREVARYTTDALGAYWFLGESALANCLEPKVQSG